MRLRRLVALATVVLAAPFWASPVAMSAAWAGPAAPVGDLAANMAAHKAVYTLTLHSARTGDVSAAAGTMTYDFQDACDGWATNQRLAMTVTNRDGQDVAMISDYTTWESKDGLKLHFHMKQTTDEAVTSDVAGDATLDGPGEAGQAHYTSPADSTKALPKGTLFPTIHTATILAAAMEGKKIIALPLFDGTGADGAQDSSTAITGWTTTPQSTLPALATLPSGRFHVAFFDRDTNAQQPDYEIGMRYWQNGVADDLSMDFGTFVMSGKLTDFKLQPHNC